MKRLAYLLLILLVSSQNGSAIEPRTIINLNGIWEFDQTINAFPPQKFTRRIPVPGMVHLADSYTFFKLKPAQFL